MEIFPCFAVGFWWKDQDASRARIFSWSGCVPCGHQAPHQAKCWAWLSRLKRNCPIISAALRMNFWAHKKARMLLKCCMGPWWLMVDARKPHDYIIKSTKPACAFHVKENKVTLDPAGNYARVFFVCFFKFYEQRTSSSFGHTSSGQELSVVIK